MDAGARAGAGAGASAGACAGAGACAYVQVPQVQEQVHDLADAISKIACKLLVHEHPTDSLKLPKAEHY